jgi:general secretion pathway protein D
MTQKTSSLVVLSIILVTLDGCAGPHINSKENEAQSKIQRTNDQFKRVTDLVQQADQALNTNNLDEAERLYGAVLEIDQANPRAINGLRLIDMTQRHNILVTEAHQLFDAGKWEAARLKLRPVLIENPSQPAARSLMQDIEAKLAKDQITPHKLKPPKSKTVSLEFRDAGLQNIFEVISRTSGINFVFDPMMRQDLKASIFVKDASVEDAIDFLLMMHQLGKKVLTENSLLIFPMNRAAQYDDLVLRSFYLNHADAKQTVGLIKLMLPIRDINIDEKLNMITLKATYDQLKDVEKLIADEEMPDPEVVLDVEILEVKRTHLLDLGLIYPSSFSILANASSSGSAATTNSSGITWRDLTHVSPGSISVTPSPIINLLHQDGDTNLLANPRIRVKNREKAKIHIGDKIPIETTTISSASNFASKSANYLDVGLKLDVEPRVMLNNEVNIKINLEVSNAVQSAGASFPTVNTRNTSTVLMANDGETQVLAGLINDEDRKNADKVPGLANIPILGRLFTNNNESRAKTEVVLLITPHVVRNILRPEASSMEFYGGTGLRSIPINFNPLSSLQQFTGVPAAPPATAQPPGNASTTPPANTAPPLPPGGPQPLGKPIGAE